MLISLMNPEVKALWIEALLSDKYTQTTGYLRTPEGLCCLGVLCDLAPPETGTWGVLNDGTSSFGKSDGSGQTATLPFSVMRWAGLSSATGAFDKWPGTEPSASLSGRNDTGATFKEIAALINEHF